MKAWQVQDFGVGCQLREVAMPVPLQGQALIAVRACGLNHADLLMQAGRYQDTPALPFTQGMEIAGVIAALGPDTAGPAIGTRVAAMLGQGGLAEWALAPMERLIPLPDSVDDATGAGFQIAYGTSHLALDHKARLQAGETLLVLGAAGGVGLTAVEIGRKMGAKVIAVARGADRLAVAQAAGADVTIDSETPDLKAALKDLGGVDVVYDAVGGPAFMAALSATRPEGRLLTIGFAGGDVPQIPANLLLVKNLSVMGLYWGGYLKFAPQLLTRSLAQVLDWIAAGELHPHIGLTLPFDRAPEGLAALKDRTATGKVVITL
ncbi:MAG: NADPH:quinone oxidoreductase family protein [Cypionkella sp.]|nr:NADPH:quinone oxidoreductase family protein [Cypionkella sp.]